MSSPDDPGPHREQPLPGPPDAVRWGSDAIAQALRALDIPYLALNPGASYRGLHDSLVNFLGNERPQMLLCLHEGVAVALAHGYAKASGRMMGAVLHSNVGPMHATMAVFNAWCDRVPLLLLGATGPWDASRRRPWIDWIHSASDQGALIRDYTKWDNQPASVPASIDALLRAAQIARTPPCGPTYVNLDAAVQESRLEHWPEMPDPARFARASPVLPDAQALGRAAALLNAARRPVMLIGRVSRDESAWSRRIALATAIQARVITDLKLAAAFPTDHPLHAAPPGHFLAPQAAQTLREADAVLALDWVDLAGTLKQAFGDTPVAQVAPRIVNISPDAHLHRGWSHDYQALAPADVYLMCEPDAVVPLLLPLLTARPAHPVAPSTAVQPSAAGADTLTMRTLARAFNDASAGRDICLLRLPLGWHGDSRHFRHPLDYLGLEGGGGVGAGPGLAVGAALGLRGSTRIPVAIMGDGDFLMGNTAVWTAAHYGIGCLMIVANNRSFFNDEIHQERVARTRGRPVENKWIGQRIAEPAIDLAAMARAQGALGIGPVEQPADLDAALRSGLHAAAAGQVCVIDVRIDVGESGPAGTATPAAQQR